MYSDKINLPQGADPLRRQVCVRASHLQILFKVGNTAKTNRGFAFKKITLVLSPWLPPLSLSEVSDKGKVIV